MLIDQEFASRFAAEWVECWNTRDLPKLMQHYADDFFIQTPYALKIYPDCGGIISWKGQVQLYWQTALDKLPELQFTLLEVLTGVNSISIYYHNSAAGKNVVENLFFDDEGKVEKCVVMYGFDKL